ncbi:5'-3' exonuclease [Paraliobacillus sp. PM-2]|uniref:5'-3' exonuclease n=1 Tax=Paraliobacillus sp. PM-2 TaxID=1462524 RepID=UPI00061C9786|nr:5'-3' exonuclease H3TH domain-containing protein [Paraliobacillus sp. PM-2]CQR47112.1 5'-3' exonuclease [Paraliobacillus sp. PM-2]
MEQDRLLLIDGFNLLSRGYFATAYNKTEDQLPKNSKGMYTNALRIFLQKIIHLINEHGISHVAVAWDVKREETDRRIKYDFYKETRNELPYPLIEQYETLTMILDKIGVTQLVVPPHEADDIIGSLSSKWSNEKASPCFIYSNDKDLFQLLNKHTSQIIAQKRKETLYTIEHFRMEYGIESTQWIDVKALLGDTSDNIPGCPGVGVKSALPLIQQYETVEKLFVELDQLEPTFKRYKKKLVEGRDSVQISKELVTINREIPFITNVKLTDLSIALEQQQIRDILNEYELNVRIYLPQENK